MTGSVNTTLASSFTFNTNTAVVSGSLAILSIAVDNLNIKPANVWVAGGAMITARQALAGAGTQNATLGFGGQTPTTVACT